MARIMQNTSWKRSKGFCSKVINELSTRKTHDSIVLWLANLFVPIKKSEWYQTRNLLSNFIEIKLSHECFSIFWLFWIPIYVTLHQTRNDQGWGGICFFIRKGINFKVREDLSKYNANAEIFSVEIENKTPKWTPKTWLFSVIK